jgi:TolB protein
MDASNRQSQSPRVRWALAGLLGALTLGIAALPASATFPGQNGRISFAAFVEKTRGIEIFTANPDGSDVNQLTRSGRKHASIISDWSPDGQLIAFDSDRVDIDGRKKSVQIYVMNADGSGQAQLTRGPGFHGDPGWSPDGESLAIDTDWGAGPASGGIWIIPSTDPDGVTQADARRLTVVPGNADFDSEPQFSPDGNAVLFSRFRAPCSSAILRVNADGTGIQRLTKWSLNASDPDWSPDGQRITFDSGDCFRRGSKSDIYVMNADGSDRERLTDHPRRHKGDPVNGSNNPVWSPDGTTLMYTRFLPDNSVIKSIRPDGSHNRKVLNGPEGPNKVDWGIAP